VQRPQHGDELLAEAVLERHPPAVDTARHEHDLLVLDVDALDDADPLGELEQLRLRERLRRVEAAVALPDEGRVEALLDRRPDRERRCEVVAVDDDVRPVADGHLVDRREEVVGGVACEHVGQPRLDAHADEREQAALPPALVPSELRLPEHDARLLVRPLRMRLRQRHRHVDVRAARLEGGREDLRVEARVGGVQHRVRAAVADQRSDGGRVGGVDRGRLEAPVVERGDDPVGAPRVEVGERHAIEEVPTPRDLRHRRADAARPHHRELHRAVSTSCAARAPSLAPPSMYPWKSCEQCSPAKWMLPCGTPS